MERTTSPTRRDPMIDSIRAIALLGVIIMNIGAMVMIFRGGEVMAQADGVDLGVMVAELALIHGKARSAFAFLFGVGFAILLLRSEREGANFSAYYLRRMGALILFGLINQAFFFWGDILVLYGLLGLLMLPLRGLSNRWLLRIGLALVVVPPLAIGLVQALLGEPVPGFLPARDSAGYFQVLMTGTYPQVVAANLPQTALRYAADPAHMAIYATGVLGLFLLGLWSVRRGIAFDVEAHRRLLKRIAAVALPLGLVIGLVNIAPFVGFRVSGPMAGLVTAAYIGLPVMALGAISAFGLWFSRGAEGLQRLLAPVGRMALTNYLASGLIGGLVLYGYGLGAIGAYDILAINLLALGLFAALALFSHLWLTHYRMGPAEWLWRSLSDRRLHPLRRSPNAERMTRLQPN